jgi:hypothetical protein
MLPLPKFRFEIISFWIGFITALLFWFALLYIKGVFRKLKTHIVKRNKESHKKRLSWVESIYRQVVYQQTQKMHIASVLFTLDEIALPPKLIAPPLFLVDPFNTTHLISSADQVIPYLPDWPELSAHYHVTKLSLPEALSNGINIAIMGQPGSGKSFALAYFASLIVREEPNAGNFSAYLPILLHVSDLVLSEKNTPDPLEWLIDIISISFPAPIKRHLPLLLKQGLSEKRVLLLLDGLDELNESELEIAVSFLQACSEQYPSMQVVTTISPDYVGELVSLGFFPLALVTWSNTDRREYIKNWSQLWDKHVLPDIQQKMKDYSAHTPILLNWLNGINYSLFPLELTLAIWATFTGHLSGSTTLDIIESYFQLVIPEIPHRALEALASQFLSANSAAQPYNKLETSISKYKPDIPTEIVPEEYIPTHGKRSSVKKKGHTISSQSLILSRLLEKGVLQEHAGDCLSFSNPYFTGYLGGFTLSNDQIGQVLPKWSIRLRSLCIYAAISKELDWTNPWIKLEDPPLHTSILLLGRWLRDIPINAPLRIELFKKLASLIYREDIPFPVRAKFLAAFIYSNDPSTSQFLKQLLSTNSNIIRRLAIIGLGALQQGDFLDEIVNMFSDPQPEIRTTACLAIAAMESDSTLQLLAETLMRGDERLRQAAAESFAYRGNEGLEVLKEALQLDDLLTRRAAVHGLVQIRLPWARDLLEKTSIQDGQWIVRNVAGQAFETFQHPSPFIPNKLGSPTETAWLITFASRKGLGLPVGEHALEVLLVVLNSGSSEEQSASMRYFTNTKDDNIIQIIHSYCSHSKGMVQETALYTLWLIALQRVNPLFGMK